jgi:hypothetical protein
VCSRLGEARNNIFDNSAANDNFFNSLSPSSRWFRGNVEQRQDK